MNTQNPAFGRFTRVGRIRPVSSLEVGSSALGIGFEKLDRGVFDPEKAYDKVAATGVKWARLQSGWARTEKTRGVYDFAWLDSVVDNLLRRGIRPWLCLCYGNPLYSEDAARVFGAVGVPPVFTGEQRAAWRAYAEAAAAHFRGRIAHYEVWNEPDGVWCWKHGPDGAEYGRFAIETAQAVRRADPGAKIVGGSLCLNGVDWLQAVFSTGAAAHFDYLSYHAYDPDERRNDARIAALSGLCRRANPAIRLVQGETGAQSRSDGAGALAGGAWTEARQAKFLARHLVHDLLQDVPLTSYFSCMDMIEALNGTVGDKASYLDYGYFGVLGAEFDGDGVATGTYTPKPSYRALQTLAALFRDGVRAADVPVLFTPGESRRMMRPETYPTDLLHGGFERPGGGAAFVYWKPADLLTETYDGTATLQCAGLPGRPRLVDLLDGAVYDIPGSLVAETPHSLSLRNLPVLDSPLLLLWDVDADRLVDPA